MCTVPTLPGVTCKHIDTERLRIHVLFSGPEDGVPVIFIHGNFSAATYFEETMLAMPQQFRCIAPDLRGYGDTEDLPIDATRGARDWSDDLKALSDVLGDKPGHIVSWSNGTAAAIQFQLDHPQLVLSQTFIDPISPFGFNGTKDLDGKPCYDDFAGSGGGAVNPDFIKRIKEEDRSEEDPNSPRNVMNNFMYKPPFRAEREEDLLTASMLEKIGEDRYPGDMTPSDNWPNVAPGVFGPINATSPKYFDGSAIVGVKPKVPILWVRGEDDQIVSDSSLFDFGTLGQMELVPGWPGLDVYPPQPMVSQTRAVLDQYQANGGRYEEVVIADAGHSPLIEKPQQFQQALLGFLSTV